MLLSLTTDTSGVCAPNRGKKSPFERILENPAAPGVWRDGCGGTGVEERGVEERGVEERPASNDEHEHVKSTSTKEERFGSPHERLSTQVTAA
jgi:hypothetical protein